MGSCSDLATKPEIAALRAEIAALKSGMDGKYIPQTEKAGIINSAVSISGQVIQAGLAATGYKIAQAMEVATNAQQAGYNALAKSTDAAVKAQQAYSTAGNASKEALVAKGKAILANNNAQSATQKAYSASVTAKQAYSSAGTATREALIAKGQAISASGAAKKASYEALYAGSKASSAANTANAAKGIGMKAFNLVTGVISIVGTLATVIALAALATQVVALSKRVSANEKITAENTRRITANEKITAENTRVNQEQATQIRENKEYTAAVDAEVQLLIEHSVATDSAIAKINKEIAVLNAEDAKLKSELSKTTSTANEALEKANLALSKIPVPPPPTDLTGVYTQIEELQGQVKSLRADNNALRAALNAALPKIEEKEDKYVVRRVEKQTNANTDNIKDLNAQVNAIPNNFGQQLEQVTKVLRQEREQGDKDVREDVVKDVKRLDKPEIEKIVDAKFKDVNKMNDQQSAQINGKLDNIASKLPDILSLAAIGTIVIKQPDFQKLASNSGKLSPCQAPALVPPVGAQTRANFAAIGTLQGVTITQSGFIQRSVNAVATTTTTIQKAIENTTYGLQAAHTLANTAWKATHMDKVMSTLSVVISLHNAAMLSRNLGETLGELTSQALSTIGINNSSGNPLDINATIGNSINGMLTNILGAETYQGIKETWNKSSRILSSASQIVWTVRSIADSAREVTEWTAENTGKIGNALKRWRVVGENAYGWMPERMTSTNKWLARVERARNNIDSLDDAASSFSGVLGEVQNIQQEYTELQEQGTKFQDNIKDLTPKEREPNEPVQLAREEEREASKSPASQSDVFRGEGEVD